MHHAAGGGEHRPVQGSAYPQGCHAGDPHDGIVGQSGLPRCLALAEGDDPPVGDGLRCEDVRHRHGVKPQQCPHRRAGSGPGGSRPRAAPRVAPSLVETRPHPYLVLRTVRQTRNRVGSFRPGWVGVALAVVVGGIPAGIVLARRRPRDPIVVGPRNDPSPRDHQFPGIVAGLGYPVIAPSPSCWARPEFPANRRLTPGRGPPPDRARPGGLLSEVSLWSQSLAWS